MTERVYIETSIISYLTARPSRDLVVAGHQQTTREWWERHRNSYELCVSQLVIKEASGGDSLAAAERLAALTDMTLLAVTNEALELAKVLLSEGALPDKAAADALHIAVAAVNGVEYLLTWNCRHMANAVMRPTIERVCTTHLHRAPIICTPEELMEPRE